MKFDIFFSICQTEVDGYVPTEKVMLQNFFDQVRLADELGYGVAWVAETHLSTEVQKTNSKPVIPHFKGEIGLNTDILQVAHKIFSMTKRIEVGSAIRNILCNGGPLAHAEAVKTFLSLHGLDENETRRLHLGFASGRFEFSNSPYGIVPRNNVERVAWPVVKGKILHEATEIFLRALKNERFSSEDISPKFLRPQDFRESSEWDKAVIAYAEDKKVNLDDLDDFKAATAIRGIPLDPIWRFEKVGVIPFDAPMRLLNLVIGTHDPQLQIMANSHLPVAVFNLSITPPKVIEETHSRMTEHYHPSGGPWQRWYMPRTALVFVDATEGLTPAQQSERARQQAQKAWENYWRAMEGTLDPRKVEQAVSNTLAGHPEELAEQIRAKYHPEDRLMLWFDFNNHDNEGVKRSMRLFMEQVAPLLS